MRTPLIPVALIAFFSVLSSRTAMSQNPPAPDLKATELKAPGSDDAAFPQLTPDSRGGVYLTWIETLAGSLGHRLRMSHRKEGSPWEEPVTVHEGADFWRNWADFPGLGVFPDGALMVHWLSRSGEGTYDYHVRARISRDAGKTWGEPFLVNTDGKKAEHGFVSFAPTEKGLGVVWLDGRETKGSHDGDHAPAGGAMTLRFAEFLSDGTRVRESLLDSKVCDCCQTATVSTSKGLLTAYRDRSDQEVRDISLVRPQAATAEPRAFSRDGWKLNACPVNGPSLSANGDAVAAVWFTKSGDRDRVRAARSKDGGETFTTPVDIDATFPLGRVDVALLPSGDALITWLVRASGGTAQMKAALMDPAGALKPAFRVATTSVARASGFPRAELTGNEVTFAWTDVPITSGETDGQRPKSQIRTAVLRLQ